MGSVKGRAYSERILRQLIVSRDFDLVFLIVKDEEKLGRYQTILRHVRATDPHVRFANRDNGIYFCTLPDLMSQREKATLLGEGSRFQLAALAASAARMGGT